MTKIEEIEQKLNECQKELAEIQKEITELNELQIELKESKKEGKWKPNKNEIYYFRNSYGENGYTDWWDNKGDNWRYNNIPIFKTEEECERYWHFMDTVKEKSYEFSKEEWEDDDLRKYYICYDYKRKIFHPSFAWDSQVFGRIHFKTEEDAQYIIDNFKDELMEYFV